MTTRRLAALGALQLLLGGCGLGDAWQGLSWPEERPLQRVLGSAEETPGHQGLLYTAMAEAEAAARGADRALAAADNAAEVRSALGDVLYALDPDAAPDWRAKETGLVPGWVGKGYGLRRAAGEMAQDLRGVAAGQEPASEAAGLALICVENTMRRADQLAELTSRALATGQAPALVALLPEIDALTRRLSAGSDADNDGEIAFTEQECGLMQAARALSAVRV